MPIVTKTWTGGGNNNASNPNDWTPNGVPQPGQVLNITSGTINIQGKDLAGDTLNLAFPSQPSQHININTSNNAVLNLGGGIYSADTINVHVTGQLDLTANVYGIAGSLTFIGGSIKMVGTSMFQGVTFDSNVTGNGTIEANHGGHGDFFGPTVFNGSVGGGITVALESLGPPELVEITHPSTFDAKITIPSQYFFGAVLFEGLNVTRADLLPSHVLQMWNGRQLVDSVRLGGNTNNLVVTQAAAGVYLTQSDPGQHVIGNLLH